VAGVAIPRAGRNRQGRGGGTYSGPYRRP
jgi:hypothetical protein